MVLQADYKKKNGHTKVPEKTMFGSDAPCPCDLGKWAQRQRQLYKNT